MRLSLGNMGTRYLREAWFEYPDSDSRFLIHRRNTREHQEWRASKGLGPDSMMTVMAPVVAKLFRKGEEANFKEEWRPAMVDAIEDGSIDASVLTGKRLDQRDEAGELLQNWEGVGDSETLQAVEYSSEAADCLLWDDEMLLDDGTPLGLHLAIWMVECSDHLAGFAIANEKALEGNSEGSSDSCAGADDCPLIISEPSSENLPIDSSPTMDDST